MATAGLEVQVESSRAVPALSSGQNTIVGVGHSKSVLQTRAMRMVVVRVCLGMGTGEATVEATALRRSAAIAW